MDKKRRDSEIEQWVLKELRSEQRLCSPEICVQAHNGVVTLNGSVPDCANKSAAAQATHRVVGIAGVVNNIRVKPCSALIRISSTTVTSSDGIEPGVLLPVARVAPLVANTTTAS